MNYNKPLPGHCEGCDEQRLDVRRYEARFTPDPEEWKEVFYCGDCVTLAQANWNGETEEVRSVHEPDPDIRPGGKHHGDPWCDPSAR